MIASYSEGKSSAILETSADIKRFLIGRSDLQSKPSYYWWNVIRSLLGGHYTGCRVGAGGKEVSELGNGFMQSEKPTQIAVQSARGKAKERLQLYRYPKCVPNTRVITSLKMSKLVVFGFFVATTPVFAIQRFAWEKGIPR